MPIYRGFAAILFQHRGRRGDDCSIHLASVRRLDYGMPL